MKSLLGVLSLVIVLVYSQADEPFDCDKALSRDELKQVVGEWVLTFLAHDKTKPLEVEVANLTSSHVVVELESDGHTLDFYERNMMAGKCVTYNYSLTLPSNDDGHHKLELVKGTMSKNGQVISYNDTVTAQFYSKTNDTMEVRYISKMYGPMALMYWREGQHVNVSENDHKRHNAMAKCLNLDPDVYEDWHYHLADFCHKSSVLPTLGSDELHKVNGLWDLDWMRYDKTTLQEYTGMTISSSIIEFTVRDDNHTADFHERTKVEGNCTTYTGSFVLPKKKEKINRLDMVGGGVHVDGEVKPYPGKATAEFFPVSDNILGMYYISDMYGPFLMLYTKHGHQLEATELVKIHEEYEAKAIYLGMKGENFESWAYDRSAEFCPKTVQS